MCICVFVSIHIKSIYGYIHIYVYIYIYKSMVTQISVYCYKHSSPNRFLGGKGSGGERGVGPYGPHIDLQDRRLDL